MVLILYLHFRSLVIAHLVLLTRPIAFVGGVAAIVVTGQTLSVATLEQARGLHDAWMDRSRIEDVLSVGDARERRILDVPTGHQLMHRPQPTQPLLPNWSCQVPSLCVSHWR